jgi:MFS family permease
VTPTFVSLGNRNFRLFASGQLVSNTGTWMQRVAQDWLVLTLTAGSGTALGITTALQFLPVLLLSLWGGVVADRLPKRPVLIVTQAAAGTQALILGLLTVTGHAQIWQVYVLAALLGVTAAFDTPVRQSFTPEMVERRQLPNAVALGSATFNLGRVLGPAIAGVLIAAVGTGWVFLINAASYLAVIGGLLLMRTSELRPTPPVPRAPGQLREGLRYVLRRHDLLLVVLITFALGTFGLNFQITTALMATHVFDAGARAFGLLTTAFAVGSLCGALLSARRAVLRPAHPDRAAGDLVRHVGEPVRPAGLGAADARPRDLAVHGHVHGRYAPGRAVHRLAGGDRGRQVVADRRRTDHPGPHPGRGRRAAAARVRRGRGAGGVRDARATGPGRAGRGRAGRRVRRAGRIPGRRARPRLTGSRA